MAERAAIAARLKIEGELQRMICIAARPEHRLERSAAGVADSADQLLITATKPPQI